MIPGLALRCLGLALRRSGCGRYQRAAAALIPMSVVRVRVAQPSSDGTTSRRDREEERHGSHHQPVRRAGGRGPSASCPRVVASYRLIPIGRAPRGGGCGRRLRRLPVCVEPRRVGCRRWRPNTERASHDPPQRGGGRSDRCIPMHICSCTARSTLRVPVPTNGASNGVRTNHECDVDSARGCGCAYRVAVGPPRCDRSARCTPTPPAVPASAGCGRRRVVVGAIPTGRSRR